MDDKHKQYVRVDHWLESNIALGVNFILSGTFGMFITIVCYIKSHKAAALLPAFCHVKQWEGHAIGECLHIVCDDHLFTRLLINVCIVHTN